MLSRPLDTVVRNLEDACRWPLHYLGRDAIQARNECTMRMLRAEVSTAFSGICAPTVSMRMLGACLSNYQEERLALEYSSAIDLDSHCRDELSMLPDPPAHIYSNILSFATADTMKILRQHSEFTLDILDEVFLKRPSVSLSVKCCLHADCARAHCMLKAGWIHVAGIPCQDWSSQGKKERLEGKGMVPLFCWIALRCRLLTPILVLENVHSFPFSLLAEYMPMYRFEEVILDNEALGHAVSRTRRYCLATLVSYCTLSRPLSQLPHELGRTRGASHTWRDYFLADDLELLAELEWSMNRKRSRSHSTRRPTAATLANPTAWEDSLVPWEWKHLSQCRAIEAGMVYTLSQTPERRQWSSRHVMQALIAGQHMLYNDEANRWATARECLAMQGFPVYPCMISAFFGNRQQFKLCSFNSMRSKFGLRPRCRSAVVHAAGNSMMLSAVGGVILWACAFVDIICGSVSVGAAVPAPLSLPALSASVGVRKRRRRAPAEPLNLRESLTPSDSTNVHCTPSKSGSADALSLVSVSSTPCDSCASSSVSWPSTPSDSCASSSVSDSASPAFDMMFSAICARKRARILRDS